MPLDNAKNFAKVSLSAGYDAAAGSIVLLSGHGARLPSAPFNAVWWNYTDYPDPSDDPDVEIVRVTSVSTDTLSITRAQEGTVATAKNISGKTYKIIAGLTALAANSIATLSDIQKPRTVRLTGGSFNGILVSFSDILPSTPDTSSNDVILIQSGVGPLMMVASAPSFGQFSVSGRSITFGRAPDSGDQVYAIYVEA